MEPRSPSKSKLQIMGFIHSRRALKVGITLFFILLLISIGAYFMFRPVMNHYISRSSYFTVVLDCGSTGTRVNIYEWMINGGGSNQDLPILMHTYPNNSTESLKKKSGCQYHCMQTEPGLDKFVGNASGVRASLEPLILWAERRVPLERHRDTPIFILATAGMRRLSQYDASRVLANVEAVVKEHRFVYRKSWIRVLSGKEEAYYGWVALNYKMGNLGNSTRLPTLGLLDLGGSSLQVVTEVDESIKDEHILRSKIGPVDRRILAYSLPAFGLNEAFDRSVGMLSHTEAIRESVDGTLEISHPCISSGFVQNYTCNSCFGLNSTESENLSSQMRENELNSIFLVGEPNWEQCKILARAAAINSSSSDWSQLSDNSKCRGLPSYNGNTRSSARFHALSGFFAVYNSLHLNPRANFTKIWEKGQQLCSRSSVDLSSISGNPNYAGQYCFRVPYLASLIENAVCLGDLEIIFGPGDISWTLGAALTEGEYVWLDAMKVQSEISSLKKHGVLSSPVSLFLLLLSLLFIVYRSQIKLPMPGRKVAAIGASLPTYILPKRQP